MVKGHHICKQNYVQYWVKVVNIVCSIIVSLMEALKLSASASIHACAAELQALGTEIWEHPELNYEEYQAHDLLTSYLERKGFAVQRSYSHLETAFRASFGSGQPNVCVVCEYDALPEMGHACGHNLIAEAAVAVGLGVKAALEGANSPGWLKQAPPPGLTAVTLSSETTPPGLPGATPPPEATPPGLTAATLSSETTPPGLPGATPPPEATPPGLQGTITILGTPAEEGGGGKILLMKNGVFEDFDAVLMVHPGPYSVVRPLFKAVKELHVTYRSHSPPYNSHPPSWEGPNALDAAVTAYNSISVLRQQFQPSWRVHMVFLKGGVHPDITPEVSKMSCYILAPCVDQLCTLEDKVVSCFRSASVASGCQVNVKQMNYTHHNIRHNPILAEKFGENSRRIGEDFVDQLGIYGSTDMIRVSRTVPTLCSYFAVGSGREVNHSAEFVGVANTSEAHASARRAGEIVAHTCLDVLGSRELLREIRESFVMQAEAEQD